MAYNITTIIAVSGLLIGGVAIAIAPDTHQSKVDTLQKNLSSLVQNQEDLNKSIKINQQSGPSVDSVMSKTNLGKATTIANQAMTDLYTWNSHDDYTNNQQDLNKVISDTAVIQKIMPDDKDSSGNSQIEALDLSSKLSGINVYSIDTNGSDVLIDAIVTAQKNYDKDQPTTSSHFIYTAHYDSNLNKFTAVDYKGENLQNYSTTND